MKTVDFLRKHGACNSGSRWALSVSKDMADVWEAMIEQGKHEWLIWTATRPGVFSESILRKLACRFVRETPLSDGRMVWDLLEDERSRKAIEVAEAYVEGNATKKELVATAAAAFDVAATDAAAWAADAAAWAANATASTDAAIAAYLAARAAAAADVAATDAATEAAQARMIAELGNPFKKESSNENI